MGIVPPGWSCAGSRHPLMVLGPRNARPRDCQPFERGARNAERGIRNEGSRLKSFPQARYAGRDSRPSTMLRVNDRGAETLRMR